MSSAEDIDVTVMSSWRRKSLLPPFVGDRGAEKATETSNSNEQARKSREEKVVACIRTYDCDSVWVLNSRM